ncbi:hypothetical protein [Nocardia sp. JMUB6875]|uniref:hypothetical protein n=1 Tax=Nocardia sp. JMUB6875 TaxID=3158170 RepID=UPI0034E8F5E8
MSDREVPGSGGLPGPGGNRSDAVERLRKKLESLRAAETPAPEAGDGGSNLTRLPPRRPRRMTEEVSERPRNVWRPDGSSIYDPDPTRPVLRSELQRETGWFPIDPGATRHPAPERDPNRADTDANVIDLAALRAKRAGEGAPPRGIRPAAKPRRIAPATGEATGEGKPGNNPASPRPDGPPREH